MKLYELAKRPVLWALLVGLTWLLTVNAGDVKPSTPMAKRSERLKYCPRCGQKLPQTLPAPTFAPPPLPPGVTEETNAPPLPPSTSLFTTNGTFSVTTIATTLEMSADCKVWSPAIPNTNIYGNTVVGYDSRPAAAGFFRGR